MQYLFIYLAVRSFSNPYHWSVKVTSHGQQALKWQPGQTQYQQCVLGSNPENPICTEVAQGTI